MDSRARLENLKRIRVYRGNVAVEPADAIVVYTTPDLACEGSVHQVVTAVAGEDLDSMLLEQVFRPKPGDVFALPGFKLPAIYVFYQIVPKWEDSIQDEEQHFLCGIRGSVQMCRSMGLKTLAFSEPETSRKGFAPARTARLMIQGILDRLVSGIDEVRLVCRTEEMETNFLNRIRKLEEDLSSPDES